MKSTMEVIGALIFMCITFTWAVPVQQGSSKGSENKNNKASVVHDQEKQLEYLASLAGSRPKGLGVEKVQTYKFTNINGKEKGVKETKNKVNGEIVSDVKEKFKHNALSGLPAKVKTEIDLPQAGIHKILTSNVDDVKDEAQVQNNGINAGSFDFSPEDVAAYLFQADDNEFIAFDKTLQGLVNSSVMTPEQASEYKDQVRQAFNRFVMEAAKIETEQIAAESYPGVYDNNVDEDIYDLLGYADAPTPSLGMEPLSNKGIIDSSYSGEESLTHLIKTAMDEWLTNAILTGDQDAEALLTNILNEVSKDDNPDDLGQMREMLMDFFTNEVLDSMVPRDQMEDFAVYENTNALPKDQILTDSREAEKSSENEIKDSVKDKEEIISNEIPTLKEKNMDKKPSVKEPTDEEKERLKM